MFTLQELKTTDKIIVADTEAIPEDSLKIHFLRFGRQQKPDAI